MACAQYNQIDLTPVKTSSNIHEFVLIIRLRKIGSLFAFKQKLWNTGFSVAHAMTHYKENTGIIFYNIGERKPVENALFYCQCSTTSHSLLHYLFKHIVWIDYLPLLKWHKVFLFILLAENICICKDYIRPFCILKRFSWLIDGVGAHTPTLLMANKGTVRFSAKIYWFGLLLDSFLSLRFLLSGFLFRRLFCKK